MRSSVFVPSWNLGVMVARTIMGISLGAIAGALSRYYIGLWVAQWLGHAFPYGTMLINVSGCWMMGFFATFSLLRGVTIHPDLRLMIATGFLGSYTTFSTYELDTAKLLTQHWDRSVLYWAGSMVFGLIGLQLGARLAEWLDGGDRPNDPTSKSDQ